MEKFRQLIQERLKQPLPGEMAQYLMAPKLRAKQSEIPNRGAFKPSAVMVLLCIDQAGQWFIPLTKRRSYAGVHSAQVSLPGGKFDAGDVTLENTARRECEEEIGIKDLEVVGSLSSLAIPVSGFMMQPFVGICTVAAPDFSLQVREVDKLIQLPLEALKTGQIIRKGSIQMESGFLIESPWYELENEKIWGATAMVLSEFAEIIKSIG